MLSIKRVTSYCAKMSIRLTWMTLFRKYRNPDCVEVFKKSYHTFAANPGNKNLENIINRESCIQYKHLLLIICIHARFSFKIKYLLCDNQISVMKMRIKRSSKCRRYASPSKRKKKPRNKSQTSYFFSRWQHTKQSNYIDIT